MSSIRYKLMKSRANIQWISKDFLFHGWLKLSPSTLKEQIDATKYRLQVYDNEFVMGFVEELPKDLRDRFSNEDYYENSKYDGKDIKTKISTQRKMFQKRKHTSSLIEDELEIVHHSIKNIEKVDEFGIISKEATGDKGVGSRRITIHESMSRFSCLYKGDTILREIGLLETALLKTPWIVILITIFRVALQLIAQ